MEASIYIEKCKNNIIFIETSSTQIVHKSLLVILLGKSIEKTLVCILKF